MADPRLQDPPRTVNDKLADAIILHQTHVERVAAGLQRRYRRELSDALDDVATTVEARLRRIANRGYGALDQKNLGAMLDYIEGTNSVAYTAILSSLGPELVDLARIEADFMFREFGRAIPNVGVSLTELTAESVRDIARQRPFQGRDLKEWFHALRDDTRARITSGIKSGIAEGQTVRQITQRIRGTRAANYTDGLLRKPVADLEAIVHTATQHTTNQVREQFYADNSDVVEMTKWSATLDLSTCVICASLDGQTWPVGQGQSPPAHPRCRCARVPVLKSWRKLGLSGLDQGTRASMDGQVPADISFGRWLKGRSPREQDAVLGSSRGRLFRQGKLDGLNPSLMLGANRRPLTVKALRAKVDS